MEYSDNLPLATNVEQVLPSSREETKVSGDEAGAGKKETKKASSKKNSNSAGLFSPAYVQEKKEEKTEGSGCEEVRKEQKGPEF